MFSSGVPLSLSALFVDVSEPTFENIMELAIRPLVLGVHMLSQVVCPIGDMIAKLTFEFYLSVDNVHVLT